MFAPRELLEDLDLQDVHLEPSRFAPHYSGFCTLTWAERAVFSVCVCVRACACVSIIGVFWLGSAGRIASGHRSQALSEARQGRCAMWEQQIVLSKLRTNNSHGPHLWTLVEDEDLAVLCCPAAQ